MINALMDTTLFLVLLALILVGIVTLVAWQRWRSRRALVRQVRELQALSVAGRAIAEARLDVDELCELIYRCASDLMDTATFQLGLFEASVYDIRIWIRDGQRLPPQRFDLSENPGLVGYVRESRQPLLVRDFEQERDRLPAQPRYASDDAPRAAVFVPLVARDRSVGALVIQSFRPGAFTDEHVRLLSIIGNQAAAAIANTRLLQQEQRRAGHLQLDRRNRPADRGDSRSGYAVSSNGGIGARDVRLYVRRHLCARRKFQPHCV